MPVLTKKRWELFANCVASGQTPQVAYKSAGYEGTRIRTAAIRLRHNPKISARIDEILAQVETKTVATAAIERSYVLCKLKEAAELTFKVTKNGTPSRTWSPSAGVRALELLGKELGMFRERIDHTMQFKKPSEMSEEELIAWITYFDSAAGITPGAEQPAIEASSEAVLDVIPQDQIDPQNDTPTELDGSQP